MSDISWHARRGVTLAATAISAVGVAVLLVLTLSTLLGYRLLVVRSDSMAPAVRAGDIIMTKLQRPASVRVGDVVTFADPSRGDRLVTHRVVEQQRADGKVAFVTRGDANTGREQWSIPTTGKVGAMIYRLPRLGLPLEGLLSPWSRLVMLTVTAMLAAALALRRIWVW